jgi:hypothetical protein
MKLDNKEIFSAFDKKIHFFGFVSTALVIVAFCLVPFFIQKLFGLDLDGQKIFTVTLTALAVFAPIIVCEFISYAPILGAGAQYLGFVTGNMMNMKVPAAKNAQKICGIEPGTPEAEAVTMIAVAVSSIVTTVILFFGMILIVWLAPVLAKPVFKPAFDNIMPAIFASLALPALVGRPKISVLPVVLTIIFTFILGYPVIQANQSYFLLSSMVISLLWAYYWYRKQKRSV